MRSPTASFLLLLLQHSTFLLLPTLPIYKCEEETYSILGTYNNAQDGGTKIAIIGGGIGGSFATKFLSDYDTKHNSCKIDSIQIFDPSPILQQPEEETTQKSSKVPSSGQLENDWQGGRVTSIALDDGTVAELGGSVVFDGNRLVLEIMKGDPNLKRSSVGTKSKKKKDEKQQPQGFGVYDGQGKWPFLSPGSSSLMRKVKLLWRYNIDLIRISRAATRSLPFFYSIYDMLDDNNDPATFFKSIDELWNATGGNFFEYSRMSFDGFLDTLGIKRDLPWWRRLIAGQGSFRMELSTAMNLCNNNQPNSQMNGMSGFTNYMSTTGHIFSIEGGNYQLIQSALQQAQTQYENAGCNHGSSDANKIVSHVQKKVTSVISDSQQMELWSGEENLGRFDTVILAAPLRFSQISFFTKIHLDDEEKGDLQPMFKMNDARDMGDEGSHDLSPLPISTTLRYTQVVTTVVSNTTIQSKYFGLTEKNTPRSIYVTERGRKVEGITALSRIGVNGVFKIFSPEKLSEEQLDRFFGPYHKVEYVKVWGGDHGGATPNYDGGGESAVTTPFLLYDGKRESTSGESERSSALYYINSIEPTVAVIELSAIGAKSVAKLVAQRLGLLMTSPSELMNEEL